MPTPPPNRWRLDLVKDVTDDDIRELSERIDGPELTACFDQEPKERQKELAALFKKGYYHLAAMAKSPELLAITGVEAIRDRLNFLFQAVPEFSEKWNGQENKGV